jgi:hypothetical protein
MLTYVLICVLYYLETIIPIVRKINYEGLERFFGFEIQEDVTDIPALQPELRDQSQYYSALGKYRNYLT